MQMNRAYKFLSIGLSLALILSLATAWKLQRDLQRELRAVTDANDILRKTLGDLTIAVTEKDKQIERFNDSSCGPEGQTPAPSPSRSKRKAPVNLSSF
jgi:hypothetical protein